MTVLKGLPMTYGKDMQEDKEPIFDTSRNIELCILIMDGMTKEIEPIPEKMMEALQRGYPTATDLADYLVKHLKIPFRDAHHLTGKIVLLAETKMVSLEDLTLIVCLSTKEAVPLKRVILFFLNKNPIPAVSCLTILSLRCINVERSKSTFPVLMPCSSAWVINSIYFSDEFNNALDGMQPIFRHVPPNVASFSMHATFIPSWAARIAAT